MLWNELCWWNGAQFHQLSRDRVKIALLQYFSLEKTQSDGSMDNYGITSLIAIIRL